MKTLLTSCKFDVVRKPFQDREGRPREHDIIIHPGAVVVLPLLSDDELIMIRNFRPALDRELWELPAGTLDVPGEPPGEAAARELEEETGYRAAVMEPLCEFHTSPGVMTELIRAFVARDLTETEQRLDPTEQITVETLDLREALSMVGDGRITDAKTMICLMRWDTQRRNGT